MRERIQVLRWKPGPGEPEDGLKRKPSLLRARHFIWVLMSCALVALILLQGMPHLRVRYTYKMLWGQFHCLSADYAGPLGSFRARAKSGKCPVFIWLRPFCRDGEQNAIR